MAGEIVDGVIAQQRGDLGEIVRALPDHALGRVDLQRAEVIPLRRRPSFPGRSFLQKLRPTRLSRQISESVKAFCDVVLQIFAHTVDEFLLCAFPDELVGFAGPRLPRRGG